MKIFAIVACIVLAVMMFSPVVTPVDASPAVMNVLQYRYFTDQNSLFTALLIADNLGGVDSMQWPLTHAEYTTVLANTNVTVEPLSEAGEFEIAFNNNFTDGVQMDRRSPMNFTDFRNAMNCLVDKQGVINGPTLGGFATQSDTQVPTPLMAAYVNPAVYGANYPWKFNVTHALQILWNGGWYNHAVYPTFADLLNVYADGGLTGNLTAITNGYGGNGNGVVYSGNDPNGQWGGGDPRATNNTALANTAIDPLVGRVRNSDARKDLGDFFCAELKAIGCPYTEQYYFSLTSIRPYVLAAQIYDFATLGYSFGAPPNWWYSELTPAGIYANGPNPYLVYDSNISYYATAAFTDPTPATFDADQKTVQYNLVMESYLVAGYCPATYCAYKTGLLAQIDILGQGTQANGAQWNNWITMNTRKTNTINYTGPPASTPDSNIIYLGIYNPPDMINPIFQDTVYDFQISDEIFTYPMAANPYTIAPGSALTGAPAGNDLPWMAYSWKTELIANPGGVDGAAYPGQWTNVTLWFRHDITWHDGVPFTVADINYTIYINSRYGDAYDNSAMVWATNASNHYTPYFQNDITPQDPTGSYTCSIQVKSASWLNLYLPLYEVVPEHLYKYIQPNNWTAAEQGSSTDGLHGLWPGQAAIGGNLQGGAPWILSDLQTKPETTLVGTGPFKYRIGSTNAGSFTVGGGITLDAYPSFFLTIASGAIAFQYTWVNTAVSAQPSDGYFRIGLADLVYLANAFTTTGTPPSSVPISGVPGAPHTWNPGADLAGAPYPGGASVIGLSDLVTLALHWGSYYGKNPGGSSSIVLSPITINGVVQSTIVNITATDNNGTLLSVAISQNGLPIGNTPQAVTITTVTTFSLPPNAGGKAFHYWNVYDPSGIGIHGVYS